jgi:ribosomal protein S18 acetylase RimI-like enzyme
MKIISLSKTDFATIFKAFNQAFADYELQLNEAQLQTMLKRRGFNPELSFAAFEGDEIVSFTFNGIGNFNGVPTAYDTGTGTLKAYRGQGIATQVFEYSIPFLRDAGIRQYLLEVLQHNTKAASVYRNLGFEVTREFNYFMQKNDEINHRIKNSDVRFSVNRINIEDLAFVSEFWEYHPSWQNSIESICRAGEDFVCFGAFIENQLVGYSVFEPVSGDITQLAVNKKYRRKGIASSLLHEMSKMNTNVMIKLLNTDIHCNSITEFLKAKNIEMKGKQFEMIKKIE